MGALENTAEAALIALSVIPSAVDDLWRATTIHTLRSWNKG